MRQIRRWGVAGIVLAVAATGAFIVRTAAQTPPQAGGMTRTLLVKGDISVPGREADAMRADFAPGASTGRHTHPGDEIDYVLEGQVEIVFDGQPPHELKAGDALIIPAGTVHNARNVGSLPAKVSAVFVVEKGKPLATPAP